MFVSEILVKTVQDTKKAELALGLGRFLRTG
jgi:hypothetical protein